MRHARGILDFDRPIALSLIALMHFVPDDQDAHGIVRGLVETLPRAATWSSRTPRSTSSPNWRSR